MAHSTQSLSLTQNYHMRSENIYDACAPLHLVLMIQLLRYVAPGISGPGGGVTSTRELDSSQGRWPIAEQTPVYSIVG
jgi:hypothetical protein